MHEFPTDLDTFQRIQATGAPIWDDRFMVKVAYKNTFSLDYLAEHGLRTSGDSFLDKQAHNELITTVISIDQLAEYFRQGIETVIPNHQDLSTIYKIVNKYLLAWRDHLAQAVNVGEAPIDDLILLDQMATKLYAKASYFLETPVVLERSAAESLGGDRRLSLSNMFPGLGKKTDEATPVKHEHPSLARFFASKMPVKHNEQPRSERWK